MYCGKVWSTQGVAIKKAMIYRTRLIIIAQASKAVA